MQAEFRHTRAYVNVSHVQENFLQFRRWLHSGAFLCPMIKANAYGLGDISIAQSLLQVGANCFGIALIEEGLRLRKNKINAELLLFGPFQGRQSARVIIEAGLTPVIGDWRALECLAAEVSAGQRVSIHLKFNTGMNRLGFGCDEAIRVRDYLRLQSGLQLVGICTHLMSGEDIQVVNGDSLRQLALFKAVVDLFQKFSPRVHALNSSAIIELHKLSQEPKGESAEVLTWLEGGRPGIGLYGGINVKQVSSDHNLKNVLTWTTEVVKVRSLKAGEAVSYGSQWRASRPARVAVLAVGYADGYHRLLTNRGSVLIKGERAPVIGAVCMDYMIIDVSHVSQCDSIEPGEEVVLVGQQGDAFIGLEEMAELAQTISYELLTGLGARVPKHYTE